MKSPCCYVCLCILPIVLGNSSVKTFVQKQIHTAIKEVLDTSFFCAVCVVSDIQNIETSILRFLRDHLK
jgi:hypothetical protein